MPKVSVLMPTYNYGNYLAKAIESVLSQTFQDFELVIVDNCSTDNTEEIVAGYLTDRRLRYFKNSQNIGNINNFNKSLEYATGDYIKYLFSDDFLYPDALAEFVNVLDNNSDVSLVTSYFEYFGSMTKIHKQPHTGKLIGQEAVKGTLLHGNWIGSPSNIMFRKSSYDGKGFQNSWRWWGDLEFWHRLLLKGDLFIVPKVLSGFRYHDSSATQDCLVSFENVYDEYYYLKYIKDNNLYPPLKNDKEFTDQLKANAEKWISLIPSFIKAKRYDLLSKALKAMVEEGLVIRKTKAAFRKVFRKLTNGAAKAHTTNPLQVLGIPEKYSPNTEFMGSVEFGKYSTIDLRGASFKLTFGQNVVFMRYCSVLIYNKSKLTIGNNVFFNNYCSINCLGSIDIGDNCLFGEGVKIYDHNHEYHYQNGMLTVEREMFKIGSVSIGKNCWIGSNVTILKDVVIGDNVIIGANNLIYKSIPSNVIVKAKTDFVIEEKEM